MQASIPIFTADFGFFQSWFSGHIHEISEVLFSLDFSFHSTFLAKAKTIKEAMANFHLPNSSIPEWATIIPEGKWKEKLLSVNKEK